jgi:hypothetical protein
MALSFRPLLWFLWSLPSLPIATFAIFQTLLSDYWLENPTRCRRFAGVPCLRICQPSWCRFVARLGTILLAAIGRNFLPSALLGWRCRLLPLARKGGQLRPHCIAAFTGGLKNELKVWPSFAPLPPPFPLLRYPRFNQVPSTCSKLASSPS